MQSLHTSRRAVLSIGLLLCLVTVSAVSASDTTRARYGLYVHGALAQHQANFRAFEGIAFCCPQEFGSVWDLSAISIGALIHLPLSSWMQLDTRLGLHSQSPSFSVTESTVFNEPSTKTAVPGSIEYVVETPTTAIDAWLLATLPLTRQLSISAGARFQYILGASFSQYEKIISPDSLVFIETNSNVWNDRSGDLPGLNRFQFGPAVGISYEIPIASEGRFLLVPEIMGFMNLSNFTSSLRDNGTWSSSGVSFGVSLRYSPARTTVPKQVTVICGECQRLDADRDTCVPERVCENGYILKYQNGTCDCYPLKDTIQFTTILAKDRNGTSYDIRARGVVVTEHRDSVFRPLLPYVFFKDKSEEAYGINLDNPYPGGILRQAEKGISQAYAVMLDEIARRMNEEFKSATLVLQSFYEGDNDANAQRLAKRRAEAVKYYLVGKKAVPDKRVTIAAPIYDQTQSTTQRDNIRNASLNMPNSYVELRSEQTELFMHLGFEQQRFTIEPSRLEIVSQLAYQNSIASTVDVKVILGNIPDEFAATYQDDLEANPDVTTQGLPRNSPTIRLALDLESALSASEQANKRELLEMKPSSSRTYVELSAQFGGTTVEVDTFFSARSIIIDAPADQRLSDTTVSLFNVLIQDVTTAEIGTVGELIIKNVRASIQPTSTVIIEGFTDDVGDLNVSRDISTKCAERIAMLLPLSARRVVVGRGHIDPVATNDEPWGRYLNRRVSITVKTPPGS